MKLQTRRVIYSLLALGSCYLALLAFANLIFGWISLSVTPNEATQRIVYSLLGFLGFVCGWATIALLPVRCIRIRFFFATGIVSGGVALIATLASEVVLPLQLDPWTIIWASYVFGGTLLVGAALLVELALGPNNSFNPMPLRGTG